MDSFNHCNPNGKPEFIRVSTENKDNLTPSTICRNIDSVDNYREIISQWPTKTALARDLGITPNQVVLWAKRDSIHPRWWLALCEAAKARGLACSLELLAEIEAGR